jgi:O-antigen/teichoic acid export membrane protein
MRKINLGNFQQQVASTFFTKVISLAILTLNAVIVARVLGTEGKGLVALVTMVSGLLSHFLSGGITMANVYFVGNKQISLQDLKSGSLCFSIVAIVIGCLLVSILLLFDLLDKIIPNITGLILIFVMFNFPILLFSNYLAALLQGSQKILNLNILHLAHGFLLLVLTVLFVLLFRFGVLGAMIASVGSGYIFLLLLILEVNKMGGKFFEKPNFNSLKKILSFGLKGYVGSLFQYFNYRVDGLMVNFYLGPVNVGIYSISVTLAELLWYLPNAVGFVIFPKAAANKSAAFRKFTTKVFAITLIMTTLGALCLALIGKPLILLLFSDQFIGSYLPLLTLLPGVVLLGGAKVLANEMAGRGYPHYNSIVSGFAFFITIILNLWLIPNYGILGASLSSSIAYTFIFLLTIFFYIYTNNSRIVLKNPQALEVQ